MAEEMRFHLEQRTAEYSAAGLAGDEARAAAQRRFGNTGLWQEQSRDAWGWGGLERMLKDVRLAGRQLAAHPGFTVLALVTLGLGIGANTSMFSIVNGVLLKPLPYARLAELDHLFRATAQDREGYFSAADYGDLVQARGGYGEVAAYLPEMISLAEPGHPAEVALVGRATGNFFGLLGVRPQLGRDFLPGEDQPGANRVVLLSARTWRKRFNEDPAVIGRRIRIDGEPHEIVGVLPASFNDWRFLGSIDVFRPLALGAAQAADRTSFRLRVVGRRDPARTPLEASAFLENFGRQLARKFPDTHAETTWRRIELQAVVGGDNGGRILPLLVGLSGFVLLIACSNLANLQLARTMTRAREIAVRSALGASRLQLLRPLVAESLLLSLAGGLLAILVAHWFRDWAAARSTGDNGEQVNFVVDWSVMAWAFGASLVTAVAFGLAPALFALRLNLNETLKSGGRAVAGGRGQQRFRQFLIVAQFTLAMILLAASALFIRGLHEVNNRRTGWESAALVTGKFVLPAGTYGEAGQINAFHRQVQERLSALPGVAAVCLSSFSPSFAWPEIRKFVVDGGERAPAGREPAAVVNRVSPAYFDTFNTGVLSGRAFTDRDAAGAARVVIINQAAARSLFGNENPLGRRIAQVSGAGLEWGEIVGVVADVQSIMPETDPKVFQLYLPMAQQPVRENELAVRAAGVDPATLVADIRRVMTDLDPDLPIRRLQTADATIYRANYQNRVLRDILGAFGALGLALATLGVYGVVARTVAQRTGEFAIRLALGASMRDIVQLVLGAGVRQAVLGSLLGLLGAIGVTRVLTASYPNLPKDSPVILAVTTLLLVGVALLACWLPASRAGRVDAIAVLRAE